MRIVITGSNGFIGKNVCQKLKNKHEVIGIGKTCSVAVPDIEFHQSNIQDPKFVTQIKERVRHCDVVLHLAAHMEKNDFCTDLVDVNCTGTLNVLRLAKELSAKKIIHSSGLTVIGEPLVMPITEEHPASPKTLYHITKLASEHIVNLGSKYGIAPVNLRISSPIGVGMNEKTILPTFLKGCLKNQPLIIQGKGLRKQNYIDIRDVASAISLTVENSAQGTFNIASEAVISNIDLAKLCIEITGSNSKIQFSNNEDPEEGHCWNTSINTAKNSFSFEPKHSLFDSIYAILKNWSTK